MIFLAILDDFNKVKTSFSFLKGSGIFFIKFKENYINLFEV